MTERGVQPSRGWRSGEEGNLSALYLDQGCAQGLRWICEVNVYWQHRWCSSKSEMSRAAACEFGVHRQTLDNLLAGVLNRYCRIPDSRVY